MFLFNPTQYLQGLKYSTLAFLLLPIYVVAQPLDTVPHVDLNRYLGKWYEIASIPQYFQRQCVRNVSAEYASADGNISVINRCVTASGDTKTAEGQARVVDKVSQAKLEVTFVKLFGWLYLLGGDYWVIDLADDYRYAVVGHPSRKYAWILASNPQLSATDIAGIESRLRQNNYDTCAIITTIQTGGATTKQPLCEAVRVK
jgi:apolipoprotein D and lipocalin family protein